MLLSWCRACFFQAEDGIRHFRVTGVQTCALPISYRAKSTARVSRMTTTLICPGYCSSSSSLRAICSLSSAMVASLTSSGSTMTRISQIGRAACRERASIAVVVVSVSDHYAVELVSRLFFSSRRRHTTFSRDWSSDVCSSDLLSGEVHRARLADDHHLDLPRVLQLVLQLARDLLAELRHGRVIDVLRIDHDADLAARLNREAALDAGKAVGDFLELLEPLHVGLEHLSARPGACAADRIAGSDEERLRVPVRLLVVMRLDRVQDLVRLVVFLAEVVAQLDVRAL